MNAAKAGASDGLIFTVLSNLRVRAACLASLISRTRNEPPVATPVIKGDESSLRTVARADYAAFSGLALV
jgi:hypothetical protein